MKLDRLISAKAQQGQSWGRIVKERLELALHYAGDSVLDVGCDRGAYVDAFTKRGLFAVGCDIFGNESWKNSASQQCLVADGNALPFPDNSFDTITAFEVLEHQAHAGKFLKEVHRVVRSSIVLSVPDCQRLEILESSGLAFHHWTDRSHCNFFTPQILVCLLEEHGFKVQEVTACNLVATDKLLFASLHFPGKIASILGDITKKIPGRRRYCMTILVAAAKL